MLSIKIKIEVRKFLTYDYEYLNFFFEKKLCILVLDSCYIMLWTSLFSFSQNLVWIKKIFLNSDLMKIFLVLNENLLKITIKL